MLHLLSCVPSIPRLRCRRPYLSGPSHHFHILIRKCMRQSIALPSACQRHQAVLAVELTFSLAGDKCAVGPVSRSESPRVCSQVRAPPFSPNQMHPPAGRHRGAHPASALPRRFSAEPLLPRRNQGLPSAENLCAQFAVLHCQFCNLDLGQVPGEMHLDHLWVV